MRPCVRCRAPIENTFVLCPHCRAPQDGRAPKVNPAPDPPPPRRSLARRVGSTVFGILELLSYLIVPLPLLGALVGDTVGGEWGLTFGLLAGAILTALILCVSAWPWR